jgi:hypothetical protein
LFLHRVESAEKDAGKVDKSTFVGSRKPVIGEIEQDEIAEKLSK